MLTALWAGVVALWVIAFLLLLMWRAVLGNSQMLYHNIVSRDKNTSKLESLAQQMQTMERGTTEYTRTMEAAKKEIADLASVLRQRGNAPETAADRIKRHG